MDLGDIVLTQVEVVWVRVIDAVRRSPVNAAVVRTADDEWRTDFDGLAGLEVRYAREIQVVAAGYGLAGPRLPAGVGRTPDEAFPIELEPALSVAGVYVSTDGLTPAAQGRFSARGGENRALSGATGEDGAFSVDLPGGGAVGTGTDRRQCRFHAPGGGGNRRRDDRSRRRSGAAVGRDLRPRGG